LEGFRPKNALWRYPMDGSPKPMGTSALDRRPSESLAEHVRRVASHWLFEGADDEEIASTCGCSIVDVRRCRGISVRPARTSPALGTRIHVASSEWHDAAVAVCPEPRRCAMDVLERLDGYARDLADADLTTAIDAISAWLMGAERNRAAEDVVIRALFELHRHPEDADWELAEIEESLGLLMLIVGVVE
jgi:hypothetical protein